MNAQLEPSTMNVLHNVFKGCIWSRCSFCGVDFPFLIIILLQALQLAVAQKVNNVVDFLVL